MTDIDKEIEEKPKKKKHEKKSEQWPKQKAKDAIHSIFFLLPSPSPPQDKEKSSKSEKIIAPRKDTILKQFAEDEETPAKDEWGDISEISIKIETDTLNKNLDGIAWKERK